MGLMQFLPSTWRVESAAAPGSPHDPYRSADAMVAAASYLHRRETAAASEVPHDLRGALAVHGGSLAYADQVLGLATPPAQVAGLPVVFAIPAPGWVQRIAVPHWPADLAAHMSPPGITNQCVAGALAARLGPHPGAMVVYGSAYGVFGHIATVRAVQGTATRWWSRTSSTSTPGGVPPCIVKQVSRPIRNREAPVNERR